jgi:hypothetical protein
LTNTARKIGASIALLIPAIVVTGGLLFILLGLDSGAGPGIEVGATLFGIWALSLGYYFKSLRSKQAGMALMGLAVIGLYANLGSLPPERYDPQEFNEFIARESQRSMTDSSSRSDVLTAAAELMNSNLPMMIDPSTRLDSTVALAGKFQYNYTLVGLSSVEVEETTFLEQNKAAVVSKACASEDNLAFLKSGAAIELVYKANDAVAITTILVSAEDCE